MVNKFLFLAYAFVWLIFVVYAWVLSRRLEQLRKEQSELKSKLREISLTDSQNSRP
jgi:CcmD family protein